MHNSKKEEENEEMKYKEKYPKLLTIDCKNYSK